MYQALYRKYRPSSFDDVCGQEHITSVLKMQLKTDKVSHAYIFCGSRGTGKTTCAKILAKAVNCENPKNGEPCNECESCRGIMTERVMDVVEMDAASNNGVDHIRRLCDEVQFLPSEVKKRVYIIDEVHMLSTSAFNALLKTIEEPPAHVLFVLATTETNDIPATIMSRCQRFDFKRITPEVVTKRLMSIAEKENILLEKDAALVIARHSDGAMRDALSLLEACIGHQGPITSETIQEILGLGSREAVIDLCRAISERDVSRCLSIVQAVYERLSDFKDVLSDLIALYRDLLVIRTVKEYKSFVSCYENELSVLEEIASRLPTETILFQSELLESFYVSYDRIATGKKASSEILMIRLCKEELADSTAALLSRIARLEGALEGKTIAAVPTTATTSAKETERPVCSDKMPFSEKSEVQKIPSAEKKSTFGTVKLKNILQKEMFLKPWLPQIDFVKEDRKLHVLTGSFVKGVLLSSNAEEIILSAAKEVDAEITSVIFEEKTLQSSENNNQDLSDL